MPMSGGSSSFESGFPQFEAASLPDRPPGRPISKGNMGDITLRAIETLKSVDLILCEDTRETGKILNKYGIKKPTMSYHAQSKLAKTDKIFGLLEEGKNLALVSDAGTPGISDPGALLVSQIKENFKDEVQVIPIPGAAALVTALSASGLPTPRCNPF